MKQVQGKTAEFSCEKNEIVTIDIAPRNTSLLFKCKPEGGFVTQPDKDTLMIRVGTESRTIALAFTFNGNNGSYTLTFNGSADDDSFHRNISQQGEDAVSRIYVFHVNPNEEE